MIGVEVVTVTEVGAAGTTPAGADEGLGRIGRLRPDGCVVPDVTGSVRTVERGREVAWLAAAFSCRTTARTAATKSSTERSATWLPRGKRFGAGVP